MVCTAWQIVRNKTAVITKYGSSTLDHAMTVRASRRKYHIIYKTTCLVTGRYYIGMHSTDDLEDGYIGSGQVLWKSIKKYGKEQHTFVILEHHPSRERLALREEELVNPDTLKDPLCMNLRTGGTGNYPGRPTTDETRAKLSVSLKGKKRTDETRVKMSIASRESQSREDVRAKKAASQKAAMTAPGMFEKLSTAQAKVNSDPEFRKRRSEAKKEPCTVDGITIFESRTELIKTLGKGVKGLKSPTFRYIHQRKRS